MPPRATAGENKTWFIYHYAHSPVFARSAEIAVKPCVLSLCNCGVFSTRWKFGSNSSLANFSHFSLSHRRSHLLCPTYCPSHQGLGKGVNAHQLWFPQHKPQITKQKSKNLHMNKNFPNTTFWTLFTLEVGFVFMFIFI